MSRISHLYESYLEIYEKNISFEVGGRRTTGLRNMTKKEIRRERRSEAKKAWWKSLPEEDKQRRLANLKPRKKSTDEPCKRSICSGS